MAKKKQTNAKRAVRSPARVLSDITERKRAEEALQQAEEDYRSVFENAIEGIYQSSPQGRFIKVNSAMVRILGYASPNEVITSIMSIRDQVYADSGRRTTAMQQLEQTGVLENFESECLRKDGSRIWISENGRVVRDANGIPLYYEGFVQDITERKRAEQARKQVEEEYKTILHTAMDGFTIDDMQGRILDVNDAYCRLIGYTREELLTMRISDVEAVEREEETAQRLEKIMEVGGDRFETRHRCKDGRIVDVEVSINYIAAGGGRIFVFARDITERKRAEEEKERLFREVRRAREQLQSLSRRLVEVQETERRFIARELHDEVGQVLTGLKLLLETSRHLPADTLRARLSNAQSLVEQLMEQVQGMSLDLRPTMLDDLGLLPALLWLTKRFADQTDVRVLLEHAGLDRRFAPEIETAAYRIIQEALTNVARHASVKEATVRLWVTQDTLHVQIEDRGQGFHVQAALATPTSIGLSGMRERAVALGGNLSVESTPGVGTRVNLQVPLSGSLERRTKER